jgi:hypothetical protein
MSTVAAMSYAYPPRFAAAQPRQTTPDPFALISAALALLASIGCGCASLLTPAAPGLGIIVSVLASLATAAPSVITGVVAVVRIRKNPNRLGMPFAILGILVSLLTTIVPLLLGGAAFAFFFHASSQY